MVIEIVDFPMNTGGSFHGYVNVYHWVKHGWFQVPPIPKKKMATGGWCHWHCFKLEKDVARMAHWDLPWTRLVKSVMIQVPSGYVKIAIFSMAQSKVREFSKTASFIVEFLQLLRLMMMVYQVRLGGKSWMGLPDVPEMCWAMHINGSFRR